MRANIQTGFFILLVLLLNSINAQELQPIFANQYESFLFTHRDTTYIDYALTDTIEGVAWTPIYRTRFAEGSSSNQGVLQLAGHFRTEDRRVYYSYDFGGKELMYDFNLEVGDVAQILPWSNSRMDTMVYRVDSIKYMNCVFDDSVKVMYVRPFINYEENRPYWFSNVWIEGVGDTQHPFPPISCFSGSSCEGINTWGKYYFEGTWYELWNDNETGELPCEEILTSTRRRVLEEPVGLSPNPVLPGEALTLRLDGFIAESVSLIGLAGGQQVASWEPAPNETTTVTIPTTAPPGVYLVVLASREGRVVRGKVVVK